MDNIRVRGTFWKNREVRKFKREKTGLVSVKLHVARLNLVEFEVDGLEHVLGHKFPGSIDSVFGGHGLGFPAKFTFGFSMMLVALIMKNSTYLILPHSPITASKM